MKNIYVISGLGADERVFFKTNFVNNNVTHIKWITPNKAESIESYALRLSKFITAENPILIGLSLGGMLAAEIAKHIAVHKIILISSAKTRAELPWLYKAVGKINGHKLIPVQFLKSANIFTNWAFSARTKEEKKMLAGIIRDTNIVFLKWAINQIANWQNEIVHPNTTHIHGTADRILPYKNIKNCITIKGGPHLMVVTKSTEVNKELIALLS
jgi:pimeloyl-ACP methyl ester carboxylesterase